MTGDRRHQRLLFSRLWVWLLSNISYSVERQRRKFSETETVNTSSPDKEVEFPPESSARPWSVPVQESWNVPEGVPWREIGGRRSEWNVREGREETKRLKRQGRRTLRERGLQTDFFFRILGRQWGLCWGNQLVPTVSICKPDCPWLDPRNA